ncbi:MAG: carbamoyltransferase C-terminal domain-containing protein [Candidatus Dojkabacteria bacterium]
MISEKLIMGIWDGHDAGVAFISGNKVLFAANEERFSRLKLDVSFPHLAIRAGLDYLKIEPQEIKTVAFSTTDPAKTLTRVFPATKKRYYAIRRKKTAPGKLTGISRWLKYFLTELKPNMLSRKISRSNVLGNLRKSAINPEKLLAFDHHWCHMTGAYATSGFDDALIVSLDGIGDGLSGLVVSVKDGDFKTLHKQSGKHSLGIFFEHVTNLLNMRELEDEGKVMALADFSYAIEDSKNPLISLFSMTDGELKAKFNSRKMYSQLKRELWRYPLEQFAYLAQRALEYHVIGYIKFWLGRSAQNKVVFTGGIAANIKLNSKILKLDQVEDMYVFPHMGDGGLALGAAAAANQKLHKEMNLDLHNAFLGPDYSNFKIKTLLEKHKLKSHRVNPARSAAQHVARGSIVLWYQGRMEYGPRALGHRSILALPGRKEIKDQLNLKIKKRVWYQPFCPSMLSEDAQKILQSVKGTPNEYMTMGYWVRKKYLEEMYGVANIDGSCRPQIVYKHNKIYYDFLVELKQLTGLGVVLNTSLNLHGDPIVANPKDAIEMFAKSDVNYLYIGNQLITKR